MPATVRILTPKMEIREVPEVPSWCVEAGGRFDRMEWPTVGVRDPQTWDHLRHLHIQVNPTGVFVRVLVKPVLQCAKALTTLIMPITRVQDTRKRGPSQ